MAIIENRYAPGCRKWNLRIGLTARCNFRCKYCLPAGKQALVPEVPCNELVEVLRAAYAVGIRRVHYTGGEPTLHPNFLDILDTARSIGFTRQIVTTNGSRLHRFMERAVAAGLSRVIVSLDTMDEERNQSITGAPFFKETVRSIEKAVELLPAMTKISCVTMKSTLKEFPRFFAFVQDINSRGWPGRLAIKLNQFFPCNPVQLSPEGERYWKSEFVNEDTILECLARIGELRPIRREMIDGDNPSYNYFEVGDTGVTVGILAMFSWGFPCGLCWKLRISPHGLATICIGQKNPPNLWNMTFEQKQQVIAELVQFRDSQRLTQEYPVRHHYRAQLGELRFDKVVGPEKGIGHFKSALDNMAGGMDGSADAI